LRRKTIAVGACAAVLLAAGSAGAVAYQQQRDERRPVGGWHEAEAPRTERTPVSLAEPEINPGINGPRQAAPVETRTATVLPESEDPRTHAEPVKRKQEIIEESATAAAARGRQKVGELLHVGKLLGQARTPAKETFRYPGATYVKLHFDRMVMLPGVYVTVSDA
jgi:lysyl endopeptidase